MSINWGINRWCSPFNEASKDIIIPLYTWSSRFPAHISTCTSPIKTQWQWFSHLVISPSTLSKGSLDLRHDSHNLCIQKQVFGTLHLVINIKDRRRDFGNSLLNSFSLGIATTSYTITDWAPRTTQKSPPVWKFQIIFLSVFLDSHKIITQEKILEIKINPSL